MNPGLSRPALPARTRGFTATDLLVVLAVITLLAAIVLPSVAALRSKSRLATCQSNLAQVTRAILMYAEDHAKTLPLLKDSKPPGAWWWYKEQVKGYAGLTGPSSARDKVFACPNDRGYGEGDRSPPFWRSAKFDFTSYVYNGVDLPGIPNVAGRELSTLIAPEKTLLVMEWTAHAPLSWHRSKTGKANEPFYNDAESVVGFVDGQVKLVKIYYDGYNAAYTRDPIPGYSYKYSGE
jgi:type II secretory pathway pseudopilin PulG